MTHAHKGNYRAKHPADAQVDAKLRKAVSRELVQGRITCTTAFAVARRLNMAPLEVGTAIDLQEGRILACQLGLFGYGPRKNRLQQAKHVSAVMKTAIQNALVDGRLRCRDAWRIADARQLKRIEVSRACEALKIKICQCQLGAF